jgi:hypothetical protein
MKRIIFCLLFIIISGFFCFSQVTGGSILILNDGREYRGILKSINDTTIVFEIDGKSASFDRKLVNKINFERNRVYDGVKKVAEIKDIEIQDAFYESKKWKQSQDYNSVFLLDKMTYNFEKDFSVRINIKKAVKILNEDGKSLSTQYMYYLRNIYKAKLLYAITISPDGSVFSLDEQALNDEPMNNLNPNYDKLNRMKFGLKNIDVESVFVWEAEITGSYDNLDNQFFLEKKLVSEVPVVKRLVELSVPEGMNLKSYYSPGMADFKKPGISRMKSGNKTVFSYVEKDAKEFVNDEEDLPSDSMIYPYIYFGFDMDWSKITADYHDRYFSSPVSGKIADLAVKIAGGEKDRNQIVKKLYRYVNRQIDFANIGLSDNGYSPSTEERLPDLPSLNVLDKSYLFTRLCGYFGINAGMYLYRDFGKGELIGSCPSLKQFDSVLCEVDKTFYSFENPNYDIGIRSPGSSRAYALDVTKGSSKPFLLDKMSAEENQTTVTYKCELNNDNSLSVIRTTEVTGVDQAYWRSRRFLTKDELDKWVKSGIQELGSDVSVVSYRFVNDLNDFDKHVVFEEKLKVNLFSFSSGKNLKLFRLPDLSIKAGSVSKADRNFPYDFSYVYRSVSNYSIKLPPGYKADRVAEPVDINGNLLKFNASVSQNEGTINIAVASEVDQELIDASGYKDLKNWYESRAKFGDEWFIIHSGK